MGVNVEEKRVEAVVVAEDEEGGDAVEEDEIGVVVVVVVAACGAGKETVGEKDEGVEKEDREPMEGTAADVGGGNQTAVAAAEY